jgi:hypothetical protein
MCLNEEKCRNTSIHMTLAEKIEKSAQTVLLRLRADYGWMSAGQSINCSLLQLVDDLY